MMISITGCDQKNSTPGRTAQDEEFERNWKLKEATADNCKRNIQSSVHPAQVLDWRESMMMMGGNNPAATVTETSTGFKYTVGAILSGHVQGTKFYCYTGRDAQVLDLQRDWGPMKEPF